MSLVSRALRVRPGEGRLAALLFGLMLVSSASVAIGESGIDALFFARVGTRSLPLMYLLQAAVTFAALLALAGVFARLGRRRTYLVAPVALATVLLLERAVLATGARWIYPVLWTTVPLGTLVQGTYVWGVAGSVTDTRQAKRLFPLFAAGGILGSVGGGLVTRALAGAVGAVNLGAVWAAGLVAAFALVRASIGPAPTARARRRVARRAPPAWREVASGLAFVRRSRLLVWMAAAAVLFSVLYYSLYLPYAHAAADRFPNADALAGFFGVFWACATGGAFLISIALTNRLFARFGVATIVVVLPVLYAGAFATVLAVPGFVAIVAVRFATVLWLQGVASPGWETLINVVPEARRDQTRAFINGGPTQAGTAIAGVIALVGQNALSPRALAAIGLAAALATAGVAIGIRRSYAGALLDALRAGRPQLFAPSAQAGLARDASAVRALATALRDPDVHVRRLAFELLGDVDPGLRPPGLREGLLDPDPAVRAAAVLCLDASEPSDLSDLSDPSDRQALLAAVEDSDPRVAAVASARVAGVGDAAGLARLRALLEAKADEVRAAAAGALPHAPREHAAELASALLADPAPAVRAAALAALAASAPERARGPALASLGDPDPMVRAAAGRALGASGAAALEDALAALSEPRTADAAIEAIRAIEAPEAAGRVDAFASEAAARATAYRTAALGVGNGGPVGALLADALLDRARRIGRSALWALSISARDREAFEAAIENLDGDAEQVSAALETLESATDRRIVAPVVALWDEPAQAPPAREDDGPLRLALEDGDPLVRACARLLVTGEETPEMSRSSTASLSLVERVLHLRAIPLLADLPPVELERIASFAEERTYADAETIAAEGEIGDELHVVVEGEVRVVRDEPGGEVELARRTRGEVIGEMSIITREPRVASLVAAGDVRTIRIGRREFESLLRERPDVALAVMRVLAGRVAERSG